MRWTFLAVTSLVVLLGTNDSFAGETPAPEGAAVYFINLNDGQEVSNPVIIKFGLKGMGVAPSGTEKEKTGHHHLIINETIEGEELNEPIPSDEQHKHFGGGQTETSIELPPGEHVLQLVVGDHNHIPHKPPVMSDQIKVIVK